MLNLVDEALAGVQPDKPVAIRPGFFLDGIEDIVGAGEGPPDLATNPKYMEGFGR